MGRARAHALRQASAQTHLCPPRWLRRRKNVSLKEPRVKLPLIRRRIIGNAFDSTKGQINKQLLSSRHLGTLSDDKTLVRKHRQMLQPLKDPVTYSDKAQSLQIKYV